MRSSQPLCKESDVVELRREAGLWLRSLREECGFSQRALAEKVGLEYYTFVSQIEAGRGRIPADRYQAWAAAVAMDPAVFVKRLLRFYEPATYAILFGVRPEKGELEAAAPRARGEVISLRS